MKTTIPPFVALALFSVLAGVPLICTAQTSVTVTRTGSGTIAPNTLVVDSGGNVVTATGSTTTLPDGTTVLNTAQAQCEGVALGVAGTSVQVAKYGTVQLIAQSTTGSPPTVGDLVLCPIPALTAGYAVDSGQTAASNVPLGTPIVGRILSLGASVGSTGIMANVQLVGPGVYGSGWVPLINGFSQDMLPSSGDSTNHANAYNYKMYGPTTLPTLGSMSSYAGWWIDRGGFTLSGNGESSVAPEDYELLRLSAVTQPGTRENTLEVFDYTTTGLGSVPGSFFNEAGFASMYSGIVLYGINAHTSGCNGTKCGTSGTTYTDHDVQQIGIESDVEERSTPSKASRPSYGVFSACVNCNNSGSNVGFEAAAKQALGSDAASLPWGFAFQSAPGAAITGLDLEPLTTGGPSDAQPLQQCAYSTGGSTPTTACTVMTTTSGSLTKITSPLRTEFLNPGGGLAPVSFAYNTTSGTGGTQPLAETDLGSYWSNASATSSVTLNLPSPTPGSVVYFVELSPTYTITVKVGSGAVMCHTASGASSSNCSSTGSITSSVPGSFAKLYATVGYWFVEYESGTWTGL